MSDVNYLSPTGLNPLPNTSVQDQAFGSGTVPASFLASSMLPQREQDYRNALNLNMESSRLANLKQAGETQDYLAGAQNRASERQLAGMKLGSEIGLQPGQAEIAQTTQQAQKIDANLKVAQVMNAMPEYKRELELQHLTRGLSTLRSVDTTNPTNVGLAIQTMKRAGVDTSRWEGMDPAQTSKELEYMKTYMDPELIKHFQKLEEIKETGAQHVKYGETISAGRENVAGINATSREAVAGNRTSPAQLEKRYYDIGGRLANGEDVSPEEQYLFDNYVPLQKQKAEVKAQAQEQAAAQKPADEIKAIQQLRQKQQSIPKPEGLSGVYNMDAPKADYDKVPEGATYTYNGKTYIKKKNAK